MTARDETTGSGLLDRILALESSAELSAFALLHRPDSGGSGTVDVLVGDVSTHASLAGIPLPEIPAGSSGPAHEVLAVVPYRQIAERGFTVHDDGAPLMAMTITGQETTTLPELMSKVSDLPVRLAGGRFDVADDEYADIVHRIVKDEIGTGSGSNFVIKRSFLADIGDYSPRTALSLFCRLLSREEGAYWTFAIHLEGRTFVGATPERHISLSGGTAVMNPISGTYRYPPTGPTLQGITEFLADRKETDELYMVLDEELKMMARICDDGGRVVGPYLKEMARLAHTEYFIEGRTGRDIREILHETMFAPTVTGSPLESAARIIRRYEPEGRGYYGGIAALIGHDANGERVLDSAILIRTADIDPEGRIRIGVGATLVRHSDRDAEVAETHAKVSGLLAAWETEENTRFSTHPEVRAALERRNTGIADFWLRDDSDRSEESIGLAGIRALVIDAEDTFTAMMSQQLVALGLSVTTRRFDEPYSFDGNDIVVLGPGPGDPRAVDNPRIAHLRSAVDALLTERRPFVAVCLSHQVLSLRLGLDLVRRDIPNQGVQREIDLFGGRERVGFYNTYAAHSAEDKLAPEEFGPVHVSRDRETHEVHALRGPHFSSMQFHAESVLTVDGPRITAAAVREALGR
ncbi:anthranilate synthase family protein [Streptomyces flaveus]|uniref:anthranilate synthase n=1 Tax=Streptomyces flaveus TaxID=66370 RepID=A0A917QYY9_9ACTN|nr:anthranilate synthase family protein [Streptomyces flaveus]GGK76179.1 phenazine-specific anthranilate synthase component I [Streptomyces flaveus]